MTTPNRADHDRFTIENRTEREHSVRSCFFGFRFIGALAGATERDLLDDLCASAQDLARPIETDELVVEPCIGAA